VVVSGVRVTGEAACVVLYLEDDDETAFLFQLALQQAGTNLQLFRVTDGDEAVSNEGKSDPPEHSCRGFQLILTTR
jgi:hypothetical protein